MKFENGEFKTKNEELAKDLAKLSKTRLKTNTMRHLFVPQQLSIEFWMLNFKEECLAYYDENGRLKPILRESFDSIMLIELPNIPAPTYSQAIDWLRDKHNLHIEIISPIAEAKWFALINNVGEAQCIKRIDYFDTYHSTLTAAIEQAIKIVKNQNK